MEERGILKHTIVHGVFVGQARSGKNSLMERLLGQMPKQLSPSTGVAESTIQVKVTQKSSNVTTNVEGSIWSEMDSDDEAIKLVIVSQNFESQTQQELETHQEPELKVSENVNTSSAPRFRRKHIRSLFLSLKKGLLGLLTRQVPPAASTNNVVPSQVQQSGHQPQLTRANTRVNDSFIPPKQIFQDALRNKGFESLQQHFLKSWSLYLTNTGGQIEFQEVLPLLVSGPSMFFFTFRLDRNLSEQYIVEYELSDGTKAHPYKSTLSTIDSIYQTLASLPWAHLCMKIYTRGTFHCDQKSSLLVHTKIT